MFCKTNKLFFNYNKINVLNDISINIETGKTTIIIGKNSSGKSTLLRCLNCLLDPTSGSLKHKFNSPFPMLFQKPATFQNTIQYNFEVLCKIKKFKPSMKWYQSFGLHRISNKKIDDVSGGEQQKTYLSRIMSVDPEVIIMDEPNQNLDKESDQKFVDLILDEKKKNKTIIIVSHDVKILKKIADKIIVLEYGKVIFDGALNNFI
tara:strand:+ start:241 stop:855 length:615 start_codon:yes stop_codon:yes gene_type:complete